MGDEEQFRVWYLRGVQAWSERDIELLAGPDGNGLASPGFGYRVSATRMEVLDDYRPGLDRFFSSMIRFGVEDVDLRVHLDGDVAIAAGWATEDFHQKGHEPECVRVRFSEAFRRRPDGGWQSIWYHRDIQEFDDGGRYVRRPADGDHVQEAQNR